MDIELDPARTAVLHVHWQNDIVGPDGAFAPFFHDSVIRRGIAERRNRIDAAARTAGASVVWARAAFQPGHPGLRRNSTLNATILDLGALVAGSRGAELVDDAGYRDGDPVVSHPGTSAFLTSDLDLILRSKDVDTVLLTGVATNVTVEGTARHAVDLGYRAVIVDDACATASDEAHDASISSFALLGWSATADAAAAALGAV